MSRMRHVHRLGGYMPLLTMALHALVRCSQNTRGNILVPQPVRTQFVSGRGMGWGRGGVYVSLFPFENFGNSEIAASTTGDI